MKKKGQKQEKKPEGEEAEEDDEWEAIHKFEFVY